jgi:DNA-binding beta-propeller fold protein YncE
LQNPWGIAFNNAGDLFVANYAGNSISEITPGGVKSTFASDVKAPAGLAFNSAGDLFVANYYYGGTVTEITPGGTQSIVASGFLAPISVAFDSAGNLYMGDQTERNITEISSAGTSLFASGINPYGMAFNGAGDLFVANPSNNDIIEIAPDGKQTVYASGLETPLGVAVEPVPEPAVMGLLAIGTIGLFLRRR